MDPILLQVAKEVLSGAVNDTLITAHQSTQLLERLDTAYGIQMQQAAKAGLFAIFAGLSVVHVLYAIGAVLVIVANALLVFIAWSIGPTHVFIISIGYYLSFLFSGIYLWRKESFLLGGILSSLSLFVLMLVFFSFAMMIDKKDMLTRPTGRIVYELVFLFIDLATFFRVKFSFLPATMFFCLFWLIYDTYEALHLDRRSRVVMKKIATYYSLLLLALGYYIEGSADEVYFYNDYSFWIYILVVPIFAMSLARAMYRRLGYNRSVISMEKHTLFLVGMTIFILVGVKQERLSIILIVIAHMAAVYYPLFKYASSWNSYAWAPINFIFGYLLLAYAKDIPGAIGDVLSLFALVIISLFTTTWYFSSFFIKHELIAGNLYLLFQVLTIFGARHISRDMSLVINMPTANVYVFLLAINTLLYSFDEATFRFNEYDPPVKVYANLVVMFISIVFFPPGMMETWALIQVALISFYFIFSLRSLFHRMRYGALEITFIVYACSYVLDSAAVSLESQLFFVTFMMPYSFEARRWKTLMALSVLWAVCSTLFGSYIGIIIAVLEIYFAIAEAAYLFVGKSILFPLVLSLIGILFLFAGSKMELYSEQIDAITSIVVAKMGEASDYMNAFAFLRFYANKFIVENAWTKFLVIAVQYHDITTQILGLVVFAFVIRFGKYFVERIRKFFMSQPVFKVEEIHIEYPEDGQGIHVTLEGRKLEENSFRTTDSVYLQVMGSRDLWNVLESRFGSLSISVFRNMIQPLKVKPTVVEFPDEMSFRIVLHLATGEGSQPAMDVHDKIMDLVRKDDAAKLWLLVSSKRTFVPFYPKLNLIYVEIPLISLQLSCTISHPTPKFFDDGSHNE